MNSYYCHCFVSGFLYLTEQLSDYATHHPDKTIDAVADFSLEYDDDAEADGSDNENDEKEKRYIAEGHFSVTVKANSKEEALKKAENIFETMDFGNIKELGYDYMEAEEIEDN